MGAELRSLQNTGIAVLRPATPPAGEPRTVIVVGLGRSGTTMIARNLDALGVNMGRDPSSSVMEDVEIAQALERRDTDEIRYLIALRNKRFASWGFKRPRLYATICQFLPYFRNPCVISPIRDPLAVAIRNNQSIGADFEESLVRSGTLNSNLIKHMLALSVPTMLVSYEKALTHQEEYLSSLANFVGIENPNIKRAQSTIENGAPQYLRGSRRL